MRRRVRTEEHAPAIWTQVVDGAYRAMTERVRARNNPNLVLLAYDPATRSATDVLVIPKHFFVPGIIEERKPLSASARRAGWVGCSILLDRVPDAGRIPLLTRSRPEPKVAVLARWQNTLFLRQSSLEARGWLLEVLKAVERIGQAEFTLADVYAQEAQLQASYPGNRNVRPKIRQQLQVLRDHGLIEFTGRGTYRRRG
jgi:type II restriction enzyme